MTRRLLLDFSLVAGGGSLTYATGFLNALPDVWARCYGDRVALVVLLPGNRQLLTEEEALLRTSGIPVYHGPWCPPGTWRSRILGQVAVPWLVKRLQVTDVLVPRDIPPFLLFCRLTIVVRNVLVWHKPQRGPDRWILRFMRAGGRLSLRQATCVLTVTAAVGRKLPPVRGQVRTVVFHGCDLQPMQWEDKEEAFLSGGTVLRLMTLGSIAPHKGLDVTIATLAVLRQRGISADLNLWGPFDDVEEVRRLRQFGMDVVGYDPVRGPVPLAARSALFRSADLLFMGSSTESFGFAMVEAMRTSTVVLAPESDLVDEICGDCAVTYKEGSSTSAADAVIRALPRLSLLAEAGLRRSLDLFTWPRCVETTLDAAIGIESPD